MDIVKLENGKSLIRVPENIRYMNDWKEFDFDLFHGPYIIDKQIPGCGFTEYCLTSGDNLILCSPRKILLENKANQHLGEVYYAKNEMETDLSIDRDSTKKVKKLSRETKKEDIHAVPEAIEKMYKGLDEYIEDRIKNRKPIKILVTYDSFKHIKNYLLKRSSPELDILGSFKIVIDEFQSVFVDSHFKPTVELDFVNQLLGLSNNICFVSATPMLDKYLKQVDYFKDLPYFEFDWETLDPGRVIKPELKVRKERSVYGKAVNIIQEYLDGKFAVLADPTSGKLVKSTEAVFYVNSVLGIIKIIGKAGLTPDQVNILCSNTPQNQKKIRKMLGKGFVIGSVPLKGQPHKMFTFCTRTVYLGADFYSMCARTFIFSDANVDSMAIDISLDLPQILGRQRRIENPWKNHAEFYFKTIGKTKEETIEIFSKRLDEKLRETYRLLRAFEGAVEEDKSALLRKYTKDIASSNYMDDYVSISFVNGEKIPVKNNLVYISEQRAYEIQQIDYKDRFSVFSSIQKEGLKLDRLSKAIGRLRETSIPFSARLKYLCESTEYSDEEKKIIAQQASESFDRYYNLLGPERCKALRYNITDLKKEIADISIPKEKISQTFQSNFLVGARYSNVQAKEIIRKIYSELGMNKSPKATDLNNYFVFKKVKFPDSTGKMINGIEILGTK